MVETPPAPDEARRAWRALVDRLLAGRPFDEVLVAHTPDGLRIEPLYTRDDPEAAPSAPFPSVPPGTRGELDLERLRWGWDVRALHRDEDPARLNAALLDDLAGGVTSCELVPPPGVDDELMPWLERALDGVDPAAAPVGWTPHASPDTARVLIELARRRGADPARCVRGGLDPVGAALRDGIGATRARRILARTATLAAGLHQPDAPAGPRLVTVDAVAWAEAGAPPVLQLAWTLGAVAEYLRALDAVELAPGHLPDLVTVRFPADVDQFATIAALRALRRLLDRMLDACGVPPGQRHLPLHAVTPLSLYSRRDPWTNLLRATIAAVGAGLGGADAITVLPYDAAVGRPDARSRRLARNTSHIATAEAHLARVVDPAGGSFWVESLTNRLAGQAWDTFRRLESAGGLLAGIADGSVRAALDEAWQRRRAALAVRDEVVTGVSDFALLDEEPLEREPWPPAPPGRLPVRRPAAAFEARRDAADAHAGRTGTRPTVALVPLGPLAGHTASSTWATNLCAVGGVAVEGPDGDGASSPLEAAATADASRTVAVVTAAADVEPSRLAATVTALRDTGFERVVVASSSGPPPDAVADSADAVWFPGLDVLDALDTLHRWLGVEPTTREETP